MKNARERILADLEQKGDRVFANGTPAVLLSYWHSLPEIDLYVSWLRWCRTVAMMEPVQENRR